MIESLRAKLRKKSSPWRKNVTVLKGDLMTTLREFDANSMDAAVMMNVLYTLSNPARCLREIYRVLEPGGTLVYSTSTSDTDLERLFASIRKSLAEHGRLTRLRSVVDSAYDRNFAMAERILRDSPDEVVDYARQHRHDRVFPFFYASESWLP